MKRISLIVVGLLGMIQILPAQDVNMELFKGMNMRHVGPGTMSGRVTTIDVLRDDPETIYIGTASGGLWKSESGGITWTALFDDQPVQSIGALAIDQNNQDVIWAGTGEGNPRNSHTSGAGIYRSLDAGRSWEFKGLAETKAIHRVIIHEDEPNTVFAAAMGSAWGNNPERGVYKTTDGGQTWDQKLFVNDSTGCADLIVDPSNPNKLFAAMWTFGRKPWTFNSGGEGSGLYLTVDGGETWIERTDDHGLPEGPLGRIGLAISASNPDVVYALVEAKKTGLYRSDDGGFTWKLVTTKNIGNRPFYYADIFVDPQNENHLFNLYSMVNESIDGGKTWETILPYSGVHPDHHAFYIHPNDPDYIIDGNDGGLNISRDGGKDWEFINNLPLGQFYHINYDMDIPYHVYGGMQDNGSWQAPGYVWHRGGIRNEDWREISFGDGFDVVSVPGNSRYAYSMSQGGNVYRVDIETGEMIDIQPVHADIDRLRFNWNAAISEDPFNPNALYFGSQHVHYSPDQGLSWELLSPDLTTNDTTKQKQAESGGLTIDATAAENYTTITCITPSKFSKDVVWAGTDDGKVQLTRDRGKTWTSLDGKIKGMPQGAWVTQIIESNFQEGEVFLVVNDYRRNNWKPYVFHTTDFGKKWKRVVNEEQVSGHALSLVQDHKEANLLFLGTENGLYVSFDKGVNWNHWTHDYPTVSTMDLKIHPREDDLIIGTFGRACYILDDIKPLRAVASDPGVLTSPMKVFEAPEAYRAEWRRPAGSRFPADHVWEGENKSRGVKAAMFVHPDHLGEGKDKKAKVYVLDARKDTLRTMTMEPDTGINYLRWYFDEKGVYWPSRRDRDRDEEPGGGPTVLPGTYELVVEYNSRKDSTTVEVKPDPRMEFNPEARRAQRSLQRQMQETIKRADSGFERIKEGQKIINLVNKHLSHLEDTLYKPVIQQGDSLKKVLVKMEDHFAAPEDFEGIDGVTERIGSYLWGALSKTDTGNRMPAKSAQDAILRAERKTDEVLKEINSFFSGPWKEYREAVEATEYSLFKDLDEL